MSHPNEDRRDISALKSAALSGGEVPARVLLAPWGEVESVHGTFLVDAEGARAAAEAFAAHGTDVPIDYEHQTLGGAYAAPSGQAPAAGWIKRLHVEPGVGLLADIEWTAQAKERLAAREYRYLSPVAVIRKADRRLVGIHSAALTNKPAIVGMQPIVNRAGGLESDTPDPQTVPALDRLRETLGLNGAADGDEVLLAASERLAQLQAAQRDRHVQERVGEALRAGKLTPAQRDWAEALIARDERLFDDWLRVAPVVVPLGALRAPAAGDEKEARRCAAAARARAEYRSSRWLAALTSEDAYVALARRDGDER